MPWRVRQDQYQFVFDQRQNVQLLIGDQILDIRAFARDFQRIQCIQLSLVLHQPNGVIHLYGLHERPQTPLTDQSHRPLGLDIQPQATRTGILPTDHAPSDFSILRRRQTLTKTLESPCLKIAFQHATCPRKRQGIDDHEF